MLNPFDFRGPEFLVFYVVLGALVVLAVAILRQRSESSGQTIPLTDYLKIAYLRGGPAEAVRVATVALVERGLVDVVDIHHLKASGNSTPVGLQRTEERVLESCKDSTRASAIVDNESLRMTARTDCEATLVRAGLLPDHSVKAARLRLLVGGVLLLGLVALIKILVAFSRGRTNVGFLLILAIAFGYALYRVANPFRTFAGEAMLADLRRLFSGLRERTRSIAAPTGTNELALVAAVFGVNTLPSWRGFLPQQAFQRPESRSSSWGGSSCGSGGSSCGSGCGGSCGGGCGGCGS